MSVGKIDSYFTKEEFEELRQNIADAFNVDGLDEFYQIKKSSYDWSSRNSFYIVIDCYSNFKNENPLTKLKAVKDLFDAAVKFIESDERNFTFIRVDSSKSPFNFSFSFQPTAVRARRLLGSKNGK